MINLVDNGCSALLKVISLVHKKSYIIIISRNEKNTKREGRYLGGGGVYM